MLTLYNRNYVNNVPNDVLKNVPKKLLAKDRQILVIEEMENNPKVTIMELSNKFNVSDKTIKRDIEKLKKENKIYRQGSLTDGSWMVIQ
ncbi:MULTISPECIES: DeoR family transcriptional regulator [Bacillota]|uniref:DeoR family transcriptional regulator n=1 Tax=Bacillota TaxID=1239 RepID=UPI002286B230|nr:MULTISPECIES: DeoR family transcriptional regulator [Bacillota]